MTASWNVDGARRLKDLFSEKSTEPLFAPEEHGEIWEHLLSCPIEVKSRDRKVAEPLPTLGELLHLPDPSLALLRITKEEAKKHREPKEGSLPFPIAAVMYYGTIAAALVRLSTPISSGTDDALTQGLSWCLDQPWLDPKTRDLFQQAMEQLAGNG